MIRPWTHLIAKYPDGIMLFATYTVDPSNPSQNKWQITAKYRGAEISNVDELAQKHIDELEQSAKKSVTEAKSLDLQVEVDNFYARKRSSIDYTLFPTDGITKMLSFS